MQYGRKSLYHGASEADFGFSSRLNLAHAQSRSQPDCFPGHLQRISLSPNDFPDFGWNDVARHAAVRPRYGQSFRLTAFLGIEETATDPLPKPLQ